MEVAYLSLKKFKRREGEMKNKFEHFHFLNTLKSNGVVFKQVLHNTK